MFILVTDFGLSGPYVGQMKAVLAADAPGVPVIDLFADAPVHNPRATAYLLAAYIQAFPPEVIVLGVVDPGVGSAERVPVVVKADGRWFVGPGNGLFSIAARRARRVESWRIDWRPRTMSNTFHGRDLFAPVAASIALGEPKLGEPLDPVGLDPGWPDDLSEVVYIDHFGNGMTGVRASTVSHNAELMVRGHRLNRMDTFSDVTAGTAAWYENANGLVEIAVNKGRADSQLGLEIGDAVDIVR